MEMTPLAVTCRIKPVYCFGINEIVSVNAEIENRINDILIQCNGKTEVEKEKLIHDFLLSRGSKGCMPET